MNNNTTKYRSKNLTREECQLLKGMAIILIFIHNFCHKLPNAIHENEYLFDVDNTKSWIYNLLHLGPHVILNTFSFWGHYGVPIFLFLSGYGLVKKYESSNSQPLILGKFMSRNYLKLWKLLLGAIIIYMFSFNDFTNLWIPILFSFTTNLIPSAEFIQGPWWFFSLIIQCYCLYGLFLYKKSNRNIYLAILISLCLLILGINTSDSLLRYMKLNIFGWCLPFAFGIIYARKKITIPSWFSLLSVFLLLLCELNIYLWITCPIFVIIFFLPLSKVKIPLINSTLIFMGKISAALFVIHPLLRPFFWNISRFGFSGSLYIGLMAYIVSCILIAILYHEFLKRIWNG